jgi:hypothetical protein
MKSPFCLFILLCLVKSRILLPVRLPHIVASYYLSVSLFPPPPNSFVSYAVRVVSKESRRLVLPRTSWLS